MSRKKNSGEKFILVLLLFLASVYVMQNTVFRPLWFDEALTVLEFTTRSDIAKIYFDYAIPNNHILFTLFLRLWLTVWEIFLPLSDYSFRLFTVLMSLASIFTAYFILKKKCGAFPAFLTLFCFICSLPFEIYSVAIRGYMQGFFAVLIAFYFCERLHKTDKKYFIFLYSGACLLAVGTIPSNLIALSAFSIYFLPFNNLKKFMRLKYIATILAPLVSFALFYAPILSKLMKNFRLKEGWHDNLQAAIVVYSSFIVSFLPLILCAAFGVFILRKRPQRLRIWLLRCLIFLVPLPFLFFLEPSPFPRVFFPLWAVWLILFAIPLRIFFAVVRKRKISVIPVFIIGMAAILSWGQFECGARNKLSELFIKNEGLDDYYFPYYMKPGFRPDIIAFAIKKQYMDGNDLPVFFTFNADHYSLLFYSRVFNIPPEKLFFQNPRLNPDEYFRNNRPFFLVVKDSKDLQNAIKRFSLKKTEKMLTSGSQNLYKVE